MMNKKLISMILPTIRANAIKEKGRGGTGGVGMGNGSQGKPRAPMIDDPLDLLKGPGAREQFNLPLEDMSNRMVPDHPRPNGGGGGPGERMLQRMEGERGIYNQFQSGPPTTMPKFQEEVPEKRPAETLAMYNQLVSRYQEEKVKAGEPPEEMEIGNQPSWVKDQRSEMIEDHQKVAGSRHPKIDDRDRDRDREEDRDRERNQEIQNPFARRKIFLRKTKQTSPDSTPLEELEKMEKMEEKHRELLTFPQPQMNTMVIPKSGPEYKSTFIHLSSNYRNLEYQKSPSSIRLYLTRFHDMDDPYVAFKLPEYIDKFGNQIYDAFEYPWDMQHHIHIPYLKKLQAISVESVKIYHRGFVEENPKIYVELGPRKRGDGDDGRDTSERQEGEIAPYYHNKSHQKCSLLTYNRREEMYRPFGRADGGDPFIDIKSVIQQGYLQVNLYDLYHQYIHYDQDHRKVKRIWMEDGDGDEDGDGMIDLWIEDLNGNGNRDMEGERIYLYSMLPEEEKRYVEMSENVLVESIDKIMDRDGGDGGDGDQVTLFKLIGRNTEDPNEENHYRIHFREMFNQALKSMEEDQHIDISQLFYFVIQQQVGNRQVIYYCNIEYIDELGHIVLSHREGNAIVENYLNTEQFGFIKKNFQGRQSDDSGSLFRRSGHRVMKVIDSRDGMIRYQIKKPSADFALPSDLECFMIHQSYEIDVVLRAQFLA